MVYLFQRFLCVNLDWSTEVISPLSNVPSTAVAQIKGQCEIIYLTAELQSKKLIIIELIELRTTFSILETILESTGKEQSHILPQLKSPALTTAKSN